MSHIGPPTMQNVRFGIITDITWSISPNIQSYIQTLISKTQAAWTATKPYLGALYDFLNSPLGIAISLLSATVVFMKISQHTDSKRASTAFMVCGIIAAVFCGAHLLHTGLLPRSFVQSISISSF